MPSPTAAPTAESKTSARESNSSLRLLIRLLRCAQAVKNLVRVRLASEYGISLAKWDLIATLARGSEGMTMSQLSQALMVSNGNVTQLVNGLVRDALAVRQVPSRDRRFGVVSLTRKGRGLFTEISAANKRWVDEIVAEIDLAEIDELNERLGHLRKHVDRFVHRQTARQVPP